MAGTVLRRFSHSNMDKVFCPEAYRGSIKGAGKVLHLNYSSKIIDKIYFQDSSDLNESHARKGAWMRREGKGGCITTLITAISVR